MSRELTEFSAMIDEQFETAGNNTQISFWDYLFGLFK